ncbi:hypothetical protein HC891_16190 [Candidatus Gracilibacteria bacterium]|nr:hypothetical protein [Candidatus Gracilibacteria bacterium]
MAKWCWSRLAQMTPCRRFCYRRRSSIIPCRNLYTHRKAQLATTGALPCAGPISCAPRCRSTALLNSKKTVRAGRLRWQRGFAEVLLAGQLPCGTGACLACLVETRDGLRTRCKDGPVFDLRALRGA